MVITPETRWAIVLAWKSSKSVKESAQRNGVSPKTARRWVSRYQETGGVEHLPKRGRPRLLSAQAKARAYELLKEGDHEGLEGVARGLQREGLTVGKAHKSTVLRAIRAEGICRGQPLVALRGRPAKRLSLDTKRKRLAFAQANKATCWKRVMFTDRKRFLFSFPGHKVNRVHWVVKGTARQAASVNHPQCLNVYAGITRWGVTQVHVVAGSSKHKTTHLNKKGQLAKNITGSEYESVVASTFLPQGTKIFSTQGMGSWVLQQDNDPSHKVAGAVINTWNLARGSSISLLPNWPPNSPDLNPIENLWGYVQAKVHSQGHTSFEAFREAVLKELGSVPQEVLTNLYNSMAKRMAQVIKFGGDKTKY
jgi:transposase